MNNNNDNCYDDLNKNATFDKNIFSLRQLIQTGWNNLDLNFQKSDVRWFPLDNYLKPPLQSQESKKQKFDITNWFLNNFYWTNANKMFPKIIAQDNNNKNIYLSNTLRLDKTSTIQNNQQYNNDDEKSTTIIYNATITNSLLNDDYKCVVKLIELPNNHHIQPLMIKKKNSIIYYWHPAYMELLANYILYNDSFLGHYCITDDKKIFSSMQKSYIVVIMKFYENDLANKFVNKIKDYQIEFENFKLQYSKNYAKLLSTNLNKFRKIEQIDHIIEKNHQQIEKVQELQDKKYKVFNVVYNDDKYDSNHQNDKNINYTDLKNIPKRIDYKTLFIKKENLKKEEEKSQESYFNILKRYLFEKKNKVLVDEQCDEKDKDLSEEIADFLAQLLFCVLPKFEQKYKFVHGDLKLDNILYKTTKKKYFYVKRIICNDTIDNNDNDLKEEIIKIPTNGKKLKLIDFAWSSLTLNNKNKFKILINLDKIKDSIEKKYVDKYYIKLLKTHILKKSNFNHNLISMNYKLHNANTLRMTNLKNIYMNVAQISNLFLRMLNIVNPLLVKFHWHLPISQNQYDKIEDLQLKKKIYMWNDLLNILTRLASTNDDFVINNTNKYFDWNLFFYNFINKNMTNTTIINDNTIVYNISSPTIWHLFYNLYFVEKKILENNNDKDEKFYYYLTTI